MWAYLLITPKGLMVMENYKMDAGAGRPDLYQSSCRDS
jgi:hypothetical protein